MVILHCGEISNRHYIIITDQKTPSSDYFIRPEKPGAVTFNAKGLERALESIAEVIRLDFETHGTRKSTITIE